MINRKLMTTGLAAILATSVSMTAYAAPGEFGGMQPPQMQMQMQMQAPPEMNQSGQNMQTPPEMNQSGQNMQAPPDWNGEQPPEKPEGEDIAPPEMNQGGQNMQAPQQMSQSGQSMQTPPQMNGEQPPEKPEGEDIAPPEMNQGGQNMQAPPEWNGEQPPEMNGQQPPEMNGQQPPEMNGQQPPEMNGQQPQGMPGNMNGMQAPQMNDNTGLGFDNGQSMQQSMPGGMNGQQPPEMNGQQPPEMNGQQPPEMNGQQPQEMNGMPGAPGGQGSANVSYTAATTLTADEAGGNYASVMSGENAILADNKTVSISKAFVEKTGDTNSEDSDFYGTNAAILANNGAVLTISDTIVKTDGAHANAVFSYGAGTVLNISDTAITTSGNNSGGLMTTGGATTNATNLTVSTSGNSSAAIRSDRGGGTVNVSEGSYDTAGIGSPAIYSTADITVSDATLSASNSEAVVIEGGNTVTLNNANVSGNNATLNGQSTIPTNVLIYQSMSGDASEGASSFTMNGGTLTSGTGSMFHVTNVTTEITLNNVDMVYASDSDDLLIASADAWGRSGNNGGIVTMNLIAQNASGNITVDSISGLTLNITDSSSYTGAVNTSGAKGSVSVKLSSDSTWELTGDTYISSFDGSYDNIVTNGHALYVNGTRVL